MTHPSSDTNAAVRAAVRDGPERLPDFRALMLGCGNFGGPTPTGDAISIVEYALEHGITWFDTAAAYHEGESERLLGRFINGPSLGPKPNVATKVPAPQGAPGDSRALAEHFGDHVQTSLDRLGSEQIDLLQINWPDHPEMPPTRLLEAMAAMMDANLIRAWGLTTASEGVIEGVISFAKSEGLPPPVSLQAPYSLFDRRAEKSLIPLARNRGLAFLSWGTLGSGFLTAQFGPNREPGGNPRWTWHAEHGDWQRALAIKHHIEKLAGEKGVPPVTLATAWAVHQPWVKSVIIGPRTLAHMRDYLAAKKLMLLPDDLLAMDHNIPPGSVAMPFLITDQGTDGITDFRT